MLTITSDVNRYAIERLLLETCDLDEDMRENIVIKETQRDVYHIQYIVDDPCYCIDFRVKISELVNDSKILYHFHVFDSKYADNGDFFLDYHLVPDNN